MTGEAIPQEPEKTATDLANEILREYRSDQSIDRTYNAIRQICIKQIDSVR